MPKIFDNALTRAQVALEDGLPQHSTVDIFDFATNDINFIEIQVSFDIYNGNFYELKTPVPVHLIFDHARLIEVVCFLIDGAIIEYKDNNDPIKVDWGYGKYTFPGMSEIIERMQSVQNEGAIFDAYYTAFAKYVAFKTISADKALPYLMGARNLITPKSGREDARFYSIVKKSDEYFRAIFRDAPLFAELVIGKSFKGKERT